MRREGPLLVLVTAAAASYPALGLAWCAAALLGTESTARELWWGGHLGAVAAPVLVAFGAIAVGNAGRVLVRGLWQTLRFHRWAAAQRVHHPGFGAADRVRVVDVGEPLAVTAGLWRPYVVISSGLLSQLSTRQVRAVLTHEHAHARRRDPLRLLLGRVLAAHLWFLPLSVDLRGRAQQNYELAADRAAARRHGRVAVASALLQVTAPTASVPVAGARFATPELLEARVAQLESGQPPRPLRISRWRAALTAAGGLAFVATVAGAWVLMLLTCPCMTATNTVG